MDDSNDVYLPARRRKGMERLNLTALLDVFFSTIFFLLLTVTFEQYTKHTIPPSQVSTVSNPLRPPPVSVKAMIGESPKDSTKIKILMAWEGEKPDAVQIEVPFPNDKTSEAFLMAEIEKLAQNFKTKFPNEKTLRLGFAGSFNYQNVITSMDALKKSFPDLVMVSPGEAQARLAGMEGATAQ